MNDIVLYLLISACLIAASAKATAMISKGVETIPENPTAYGGNSFLLHCLVLQFLMHCKKDDKAPSKEG